jgi:hypothetical protein
MLLKNGSTGSPVAAVQFALNSAHNPSTPLKVDGIFGPKTEAVTRSYQSRHALKPDGLVGPLTLDKLFQVLTMTARVRMRPKYRVGSAVAPPVRAGGLSNRPAPPAWESPWVAEMRRAHEAFLKWMAQPVPKPPLPAPPMGPPSVVIPTNLLFGPFGPLLPDTKQVTLPGPPATSSATIPAPVEGSNVAVQVGAESTFNILQGKHEESEYKLTLDWGRIMGTPWAQVGLGTSLVTNHEGDVSVEVEVSVTGKGLEATLGNKVLSLEAVPYFTTAISSQVISTAYSAFLGIQAAAQVQVVKDRVFIGIGGQFGAKGTLERAISETGHLYYRSSIIPLAGTGMASLTVWFP